MYVDVSLTQGVMALVTTFKELVEKGSFHELAKSSPQLQAIRFSLHAKIRQDHYRKVCSYLQLPPDAAILTPRPPTDWDPARTYILVEQVSG